MKILLIFLAFFVINIKADKIYYDDSNQFFSSKESQEFLKKYFNKPLNTLLEAVVELKVIKIQRSENVKEICKIFEMRYDAQEDSCFDDFGSKYCDLKSPNEMEKYILESVEIPVSLNNSQFMFMENNICGYEGVIQAFGHIWVFESRGGGTELTRTLSEKEKIFSINESSLEAYRQGLISDKKAKKYLVCKSQSCSPKALLIEND